jgi:urease accessory protein
MRGLDARWDVDVEVEPGGALAWDAEPFVVAEGADVHRGLRVEAGGAVSLRETLVLGRSGEGPGRLRTRTDVTRDGVPVLVEELDSAVGLGGHRVLDQLLHLGTVCEQDGMRLASSDCLHRWLGADLHESRLYSSSPSPE